MMNKKEEERNMVYNIWSSCQLPFGVRVYAANIRAHDDRVALACFSNDVIDVSQAGQGSIHAHARGGEHVLYTTNSSSQSVSQSQSSLLCLTNIFSKM